MRTGSTAMPATVSGCPASESAPNVIADAPSATPSGSSRRRLRNTSASVPAITRTAAISRMSSERLIASVRSLTSTGAPVTANDAWSSANSSISVAARMSAMASRRCSSLSPGFSRTWMSAASRLGNR